MSEIEARMMWAPGKYIQGQNVLPNLGVYVRLLGESACRTEESIHNEPFDVTLRWCQMLYWRLTFTLENSEPNNKTHPLVRNRYSVQGWQISIS